MTELMPRTTLRSGGPVDLHLRATNTVDIPVFFEEQIDPVANHMAAFTAKDPTDRTGFTEHWERALRDGVVIARTILLEGRIAGYVASFERLGKREVSYWVGRPHWGRGVATLALSKFLNELTTRPLYARTVKDHVASLRVLSKCGFTICGEDKGFANARGKEVDEIILELR
jgi:RimJ/RimL family protein N-acetyltransferase